MRAGEPDAPTADLRRAPWWRRALAGVADMCVILAVVLPVVGLRMLRRRDAVAVEPGAADEGGVRAVRLLGSLIALLRRLGESPGFRVTGLEVRDRLTGRRPALARTLLRTALDELPAWVTRWATSAARERQRARRAELRRTPGGNGRVAGAVRTSAQRFFAEQLLVGQLVRLLAAPLRRRLDARVVTVRRV
jgi:RDD family